MFHPSFECACNLFYGGCRSNMPLYITTCPKLLTENESFSLASFQYKEYFPVNSTDKSFLILFV